MNTTDMSNSTGLWGLLCPKSTGKKVASAEVLCLMVATAEISFITESFEKGFFNAMFYLLCITSNFSHFKVQIQMYYLTADSCTTLVIFFGNYVFQRIHDFFFV